MAWHASNASLQGPRGFSLALIFTASAGMPRTADSWAMDDSLKNGSDAPAVSMVAMRPKFRRVNPRPRKSCCCVSVKIVVVIVVEFSFIGFLLQEEPQPD